MKRVMVIGVSAGVGKSSFSRELGKLTGIQVTHLDRLYWKPGWVEAPSEEFSAAQRKIVKKDQWIIEGNYTSTIEIREPLADTVIYLELPMCVCLYRVIKRRIQYHGKTREDLTQGCPEKIDWAFVKFIVTTYSRRKKKMLERMQRYANEGKTVHHLKSSAQIEGFLSTYLKGK
ncbi:topology modulation protein [Sporosarcina luteola]|uniref:Topology modulation protein n=1 Tax=Sporosarcina luteola TaxID=582850 RepID=A0A511ZBN2_9BACL|nr:topology modulation protein [Sporosarcina luteola]GEN84852.1 topology modulation protein [Sporosarcina luteola]